MFKCFFEAGKGGRGVIGFASMLCENCHEKQATVHVTQIVDGQVEKHHLCEGCAAEKGLDVQGQPMDLGGMLETLKDQLAQLKASPAVGRPGGAGTCPACGTTRTEILKRGRMGCDRCYETFAAEMLPVVVSLQHGDQHLGKVPRRASQHLKVSVELARLRRELDQAVAAENYELAARLRDQIKGLPADEVQA
jgi:protein arginine kinase activator